MPARHRVDAKGRSSTVGSPLIASIRSQDRATPQDYAEALGSAPPGTFLLTPDIAVRSSGRVVGRSRLGALVQICARLQTSGLTSMIDKPSTSLDFPRPPIDGGEANEMVFALAAD